MSRSIVVSALVCLLLPACSSDDSPASQPQSPQPDAAPDHTTTADAEPDNTTTPDAPETPDAGPDAQSDAEPDASAPPSPVAAFTVSDFSSAAQLVTVDLHQPAPNAPVTFDDQDSIVVADRTFGFVMHRTDGTVSVLDAGGAVVREVDVNTGGNGAANPYAAIVPASGKAYVIRYGQNTVAVIDTSTNPGVTGQIDLSGFVDDPDGLVDAFAGVFDPATKRAYIGIQRIDQTQFGDPPDYAAPCLPSKAAVVGIDTTTDTVIDLNGAADGKAIELDVVDPIAMVHDAASGRLLLLGVGCAASADAGAARVGRGVQSVDLANATASWLWQTQDLARPAALIWIGSHEAILGVDDDLFMRHWYRWDPATATPGAELQGVPQVPTWDGDRGLIGLAQGSSDGGSVLDVVRYDLDDGTSAVIVPAAIEQPGVFPYSSATLR